MKVKSQPLVEGCFKLSNCKKYIILFKDYNTSSEKKSEVGIYHSRGLRNISNLVKVKVTASHI